MEKRLAYFLARTFSMLNVWVTGFNVEMCVRFARLVRLLRLGQLKKSRMMLLVKTQSRLERMSVLQEVGLPMSVIICSLHLLLAQIERQGQVSGSAYSCNRNHINDDVDGTTTSSFILLNSNNRVH
mmetsp:Transcript_14464/g.21798  ORF Transcript_14464/g.21798 Transcript_14464/m.21798 type:complete len:126 (+) Transcript_14464:93-470(+)